MSRFTPTTTIALTDADDTITMRTGLTYGQRADYADALMQIEGEYVTTYRRQLLMLEATIEDWSGPSFDAMPITRTSIAALDPRDPLVQRAVAHAEAVIYPKAAPLTGDTSSTPSATPTSSIGDGTAS
ncbi:hypothetical protein [Herpetosiphon geysericola]|uniref:Uncharacterized protein n=1 Tax=Herpetosiphon geysericola TaxID=70996 RepID=A0A0P6YE08_9CHLR|nr:hypothetical protein [Herpetosiphon geysericola]KPL80277.1 hypothetical protein SE18_24830 [Herpetosiphon geysericola]